MPAPWVLTLPDGRRVLLDRDLVVGRAAECDVVLAETGVSRRHARIFREGEALFVADEGARNGVFVDARRVEPGQPHRLAHGDRITLGSAELGVEVRGPAPVAPSPLPAAATAPPPAAAPVPSAAPPGSAAGLQDSLAALGIPVTFGQLAGTAIGTVAGTVLSHVLPYVWPLLDPFLTAAFGSGASTWRDGFNRTGMLLATFGCSFVVSLVLGLVFARWPRRSAAS